MSQGDDNVPVAATRPAPQSFWLVVLVPALVGAWQGHGLFGVGPFPFTNPSLPAMIGAAIGALAGIIVGLDDRYLQRRTAAYRAAGGGPPEELPRPSVVSGVLACVLLLIPVVIGVVTWESERLGLTARTANLLRGAGILATTLLAYVDLRLLVLRTPGGLPLHPPTLTPEGQPVQPPLSPPAGTFLGLLFLWAVMYPLHFVLRSRFGVRNLIVLGIIATGIFWAAPLRAWWRGPDLPAVDSPEALATLLKILEDSPDYRAQAHKLGKLVLRDPKELSFDKEKQERIGQVTVGSLRPDEQFLYAVRWHDRKTGTFMVELLPKEP